MEEKNAIDFARRTIKIFPPITTMLLSHIKQTQPSKANPKARAAGIIPQSEHTKFKQAVKSR